MLVYPNSQESLLGILDMRVQIIVCNNEACARKG